MSAQSQLGTRTPAITVPVEAGQLKFFAKATGETNPVYTNEAAAREAGYRALPAPPTFVFSLNLARPDPFGAYTALGLDLGRILHAEQAFEYLVPVCAGDTITIEEVLTDVYDKKGGALTFYVFESTGTNQHGEPAVRMKNTLVHRNG